MSKKLLVIVIAVVLAASIVGASFALYVKSAEKDVAIGYDADAISLTLSTNAASLTLNNLSPEHDTKTITVTLGKDGLASPAANMKGFFKIDIANVGGGDLASAITASAVVTHKAGADPATSNLDQDALTGTGYACLLSDLPESIALTIALNTTAPGFDFADYAEEAIQIKLYWTPYDNTVYYLRSADTDWLPDPQYVFVAHTGDEVKLEGITLAANQEFKLTYNGNWINDVKGDGSGNRDSGNKALGGYLHGGSSNGDNMYVAEAGVYDFYYSPTNGLWVNKVG